MKEIKTLEEAFEVTKRKKVDFSFIPKVDEEDEIREYFENQYNAVVLTEAINGGWKADWNDGNQRKWFPIFWMSPSGIFFYHSNYDCSNAYAGDASRLCFETEAEADFAGKNFKEVYEKIILK